jgi:hypothetical protein
MGLNLRSLPRHGIMAEVSLANRSDSRDETLTRWTIAGLIQMGVLRSADEVAATRVLHVPHAYPVPTHRRDAIVSYARRWPEDQGIESVGRFGQWAYINSDEAMARGMSLGARLGAASAG